MFLESVYRLKISLVQRMGETRSLAPMVGKKPQLLKYWLLNARHGQIAFLAALILLPTLVPMLLDTILDFVFPPVTRDRLFGILQTSSDNPLRQGAGIVAYIVVYAGTLAGVVYLFLKEMPAAKRYAEQFASEKAREAERLAVKDPAQCNTLFSVALEWAPGQEQQDQIKNKMTQLGLEAPAVSAVVADSPAAKGGGTVVFEAGDSFVQTEVIDGRYEIMQELGRGAMGTVYKARDDRLDRLVALKQLAPDLMRNADLLARFRQEAKALAKLSHANIVQVYDFIEANGHYWIAMELVDGRELEEVIPSAKHTSSEVKELGRQMAEGLGYAHDKGIVHRDFKPANILITSEGQVKITDFGIAKIANSSVQTQMNTIMGSPAYMSPEQASGKPVDHRTDIYALGVTLYWMLAGKLPFEGDTTAIIAQHLTKAPPPLKEKLPRVPAYLHDLIMGMLEKDPAKRPQSMAEVAQVLARKKG